jgi:hypothetical protein
MGSVSTQLEREAESIFDELGYAVTADEQGFRAERKWRVVEVTAMPEPGEVPASGGMRCFVTWAEQVGTLEREIRRANPGYDWAIIGIDDGEYVVSRRPT